MTLDDTRNLFEQLLSRYFKNHPKLRDPSQAAAYHEVLAPYAPADVKSAALQCLREKPHFPDPQEIAAHCPPLPPPVRHWQGWPAYGYRDEADYLQQIHTILEEAKSL